MVEAVESEQILSALRLYLEDLRDTGLDALPFRKEAVESVAEVQVMGNKTARLLFLFTGNGFEGEAGELLANIVKAMGFGREEVCLLCFPDESGLHPSRAAILAAIRDVGAEVVVVLGDTAARLLLESHDSVAELCGAFSVVEGIAVMPSHHPQSLLEDPSLKRQVWSDMQQVMRRLKK